MSGVTCKPRPKKSFCGAFNSPLTAVISEIAKRWKPEGWIFHCVCLTCSQLLPNEREGFFFFFPLCLSGVLPRAVFALHVNNLIEEIIISSCEELTQLLLRYQLPCICRTSWDYDRPNAEWGRCVFLVPIVRWREAVTQWAWSLSQNIQPFLWSTVCIFQWLV